MQFHILVWHKALTRILTQQILKGDLCLRWDRFFRCQQRMVDCNYRSRRYRFLWDLFLSWILNSMITHKFYSFVRFPTIGLLGYLLLIRVVVFGLMVGAKGRYYIFGFGLALEVVSKLSRVCFCNVRGPTLSSVALVIILFGRIVDWSNVRGSSRLFWYDDSKFDSLTSRTE
jgi:hypothetical protein